MKLIREFLKYEASGGILIFLAAIIALTIKNSSFEYLYDHFLNVKAIIKIGKYSIAKPLLFWINDGLMAVFFFLVALEIKRKLKSLIKCRKLVWI